MAISKRSNVPWKRILAAGTPLAILLVFMLSVRMSWIPLSWAFALNGNRFALDFVLAVVTALSQLVIFINLLFYLSDIYPSQPGPSAVPTGSIGRRTFLLLCGSAFAFGIYFLYAAFTFFGLSHDGVWIFSVDGFSFISRVVTVVFFVVFLIADASLVKSWDKVLKEGAGNAECGVRARSLAWFSVFLIDLPSIAVTLTSWGIVHALRGSEFVSHYKDVGYVSLPVVAATIDGQLSKLFFDGLDTGVMVTTMLISQFVFAILVIQFGEATGSVPPSGPAQPVRVGKT